ncbi:potassium uptake protein, integral membrane component, KtrB [Candidatus Kuenenia stuttgartiensis]|uniref:Potassium uptake protein, integral membrane component, KtrB n=2 Tax=Kuenenia stuttgartiensis TaxID=174633 RepID=A0A2C9CIC5_KUEST|nr:MULTISPECIES: potassium transporter TrkG [Kuenenia]MBE7546219.1 Trk family potassium uptake protein [Planctomycetia bacterium]MCZ7554660.1 hypothetical protein [Anaerolineales bacterium]MBW7941940.1 Trk family potassium uptake protein [Candidatus Kuenenia stuttgartiensis]MBZ0192634.1 hypothetical protein [Candidatus Kuenenia stuttgartiensis]MCF6152978.1 Trk family potassium uptake protein [Candidatus Kuenenia stuttgartiensis]
MSYFKSNPYRIILFGFIFIIIIGTFLLAHPVSSTSGEPQSVTDAFFAATSAISTTGLSVVDIGKFYTIFGQVIILMLFQIGGLGYMIFIVLIMYGLGIRLSLSGRVVLEESFSSHPYEDILRFSKIICLIAFVFEFSGAVFLTLFWMKEFPLKEAVYLGIFHAISAFCTAGFSLFPDNFCTYGNSIYFNFVINGLCIAGSIGFPVIYDIYQTFFVKSPEDEMLRKISVHTRLVMVMMPLLIFSGWILIFLFEWHSPFPTFKDRVLTTLFQTISTSTTTGFNTVNIGTMKISSLTMMLLLMYIGAPAGGTGGGVKSTTFGVLIASIFSVVSMEEEPILFNKRISAKIRAKAFAICTLALLVIITDILILSATEKAAYIDIVYETFSAFGTVGLSTGITPSLSVAGKFIICATMLIGRIGPLVIGYSVWSKKKTVSIKYPQGIFMVG